MTEATPRNLADTTAVGRVPMVAAIAVIAAVAGSLWFQTREDRAPEPMAQAAVAAAEPVEVAAAPPPTSAAERAFLEFSRAEPPPELTLDHAYTAEGLRRLAAAVAVAGESALWRDRARRLEAAAAELGEDEASLEHADVAREAFIDAADWLGVPEARTAAEAISPDDPLREQKDRVIGYFHAVAQSLERPLTGSGAAAPGSPDSRASTRPA
jgi:hypothetical protein